MTRAEIRELRELLRREAETTFPFERLYRQDKDAVYSDYDGYAVTAHEMAVFHLEAETIPRLAAALMFYEDMCALNEPPFTEGRAHALVMKAREIAPKERFHGHEVAFDGSLFHVAWFLWFATTFADVTMRQAYAFFRKHEAASPHLNEYVDGS